MKQAKIKELKEVVNETEADDYIRCLATGKFYKNGVEITEQEWNKQPDKIIKIDLGPGIKPEEP